MHLDIKIIRSYRRSDGIYTRLDDPNTLTRQSDGTNDAPREPIHGPVTSITL